jgi:hypothetical protein
VFYYSYFSSESTEAQGIYGICSKPQKKKMAELGLKPASSNIKIGLFSVD